VTLKGSKCFLLGGEGREKTLLAESGWRVVKKEVEGDESGRRDWNWKCKRIVSWICSAIYTYTKENEWKCNVVLWKGTRLNLKHELSWETSKVGLVFWVDRLSLFEEKSKEPK